MGGEVFPHHAAHDEQELKIVENSEAYSARDPSTWRLADAYFVGLDIGMASDHSALVLAGLWPRGVIGVVDMQRFPLGAPYEFVADTTATVVRDYRAKVVADASNNGAFIGVLAVRLPAPAMNWLTAGVITAALSHSAYPQRERYQLGGSNNAVGRWTLSKAALVQDIAAEIGNGSLILAKRGDWEAMEEEILDIEQVIKPSGSVSYSARSGKHDDLVMALSLAVFGCRRLGPYGARGRQGPLRRGPSSSGWT
jgi:hypothetical protein